MPLKAMEIKAFSPTDKLYRKPDGQGMYLEIRPNGSKLWFLKYRITHMLVIAEGGESEVPYVLAARQTEGWFAPPMLVENGTEGMLIHAPGHRPESVSGRADIVLSRHSQGWTTFSIPDLLAEAQNLMPQGFTLAQVAQVDLSAMIMNVPASRADDSACCPTGGMATIILDMPEANMIRVSHVAFIETNPDATWLVKPAGAPDLGED